MTFRDKVELDDGSLDLKLLAQAWRDGDLTPDDELKMILEHVYYSHEDPAYRKSCEFIKRAAKLLEEKTS